MPPTLKILVIPISCAAYKIAGLMLPFLSGGENKIMVLHPANFAGIANIKTVEKSGAVPPGI